VAVLDRWEADAVNELLTIDAATYHRDQLGDDRPSLSASLIKTLLNQSPLHAKAQHPKLNPDFQRVDEDRFDIGTTVHRLFLEGESAVEVVYADSWRTKDAKEQRDTARSYGRIAMLEAQWDECCQMVAALRVQCDNHPEGPFFTAGKAELPICWEDEYGVLCRARLDWLLDDHTAVHDLKTTKASAHPDAWQRTGFSIGADIQMAFYLRGLKAVFGVEPAFQFVVAEVAPPYAMSVCSFAPDALALADRKISAALKTWAMCLRNDSWPGYEQRVAYIEAPAWAEAQWLERELREVA